MRILLDLDEVCCDFCTPAWKIHGYSREQADELIRKTGKYLIQDILELEDWEFWEPINSIGEDFWINLEPLEWFENLLDFVEDLVGKNNWYIVTAPARDASCVAGKRKWIHNHLGERFDRFAITKHKQLMSTSDSVLIDDSERQIKEFQGPGFGQLFPHVGNSLKVHASNPLKYLKSNSGFKSFFSLRESNYGSKIH